MGGLAVDIKAKGVVSVAYDCHVQHGNATVVFNLLSPLDVWVNGIEIVVEWLSSLLLSPFSLFFTFPLFPFTLPSPLRVSIPISLPSPNLSLSLFLVSPLIIA